jgi:hypothetical protein
LNDRIEEIKSIDRFKKQPLQSQYKEGNLKKMLGSKEGCRLEENMKKV